MRQRPATLSQKQVAALAAVASGASVEETATQVGVNRTTIWKWKTRPGPFRNALREAQAEVIHQTVRTLAQTGPPAAVVLTTLISTETVPPAVRTRAAAVLLRELREFVVLADLEDRLQEVEVALGIHREGSAK